MAERFHAFLYFLQLTVIISPNCIKGLVFAVVTKTVVWLVTKFFY